MLTNLNINVYYLNINVRTNDNYPRKEQRMVTRFIRDIPRVIRDNFKALCVIRGITMRQAIVEMMLKALEGSLKSRSDKHSSLD